MCQLLTWLTDQYLGLRVPFAKQLEHWQKQLLHPDSDFRDWMALLKASSQLRSYRMAMVEPQEEALDEWLDETNLELDPRIEVRLNDVLEHFSRVSCDAEVLQNDLENLVQIYFLATNQAQRSHGDGADHCLGYFSATELAGRYLRHEFCAYARFGLSLWLCMAAGGNVGHYGICLVVAALETLVMMVVSYRRLHH